MSSGGGRTSQVTGCPFRIQPNANRESNMPAQLWRPKLAASLILVALAHSAQPRAEAQIGIGMGLYGDPFAIIASPTVPSPTDYLYNISLARAAAHASADRQTAAQMARSNPNAYWNRIRDNSGANTYDLTSRQSLSHRVGATARPAPAAATAPSRPRVHALDDYFLDGSRFDWPRDAPEDGPGQSDRAAADHALRAVFEQVRSGGTANAQSVAAARAKVIAY